ncbi:hypothetical protein X777_07653 [Ooceraea biroi]|uniref:Myb/SANT-like DNA-binding domain-containing protein n=1 Tax=Ooceraea biroi TaxID=2015173 RepID=A0A026WA39_OOCBI|nr:hypothetical protein X777_07653 [Ooceraea biroi]
MYKKVRENSIGRANAKIRACRVSRTLAFGRCTSIRDIAALVDKIDNCYIKWNSMKKRYKKIRDTKNHTGAAKQTWEYFEIMHDMLRKNPEVTPLSIPI